MCLRFCFCVLFFCFVADRVYNGALVGTLNPGHASKWAGRLAFLNAYVSNRLGRSLLRPIIWRQRTGNGSFRLTPRLRNSLLWFLTILESGLVRHIPLGRPVSLPVVLLYSDAEGNGRVGGVLVCGAGSAKFFRGVIPRNIQRLLKRRRTNITAFELLAALAAITVCGSEIHSGCRLVHFIDSTSALACVVRGFSTKPDLSVISGRVWFELARMNVYYTAEYVSTSCNLADGPSRDSCRIMDEIGAVEIMKWTFPWFSGGLDGWMSKVEHAELAVR